MIMKLILTVGISGSGKTTFCSTLNPQENIILCPDKMRAIVGRDESDQSVNGIVFASIHRAVEYLLKHGTHNVVIHATHYSATNRKDFISIARKYNVTVEAVYLPVALALAKQRNAKRDRVVPEAVITRQFDEMDWPTPPEVDKIVFFDEGMIRSNNFYSKNITPEENEILQQSIALIDKGKSPFGNFAAILQKSLA